MQHTTKLAVMLLVTSAALLGGCVTEQHARNEPCPANHTLVCSEHMGQDQGCRCHSKATLRDVFGR